MSTRRVQPAFFICLALLTCLLLLLPGEARAASDYNWTWPVQNHLLMQGYRLSGEYPGDRNDPKTEKRKFHYAIDIKGWEGSTPVRAVADGVIYCVYMQDNKGTVSSKRSCPNPKCRLSGVTGRPAPNRAHGIYPPGNHVILYHENGENSYYTLYLHLAKKTVEGIRLPKPGEGPIQIKQGTVLGYVGDTGYSAGAHLHFAAMKGKGEPGYWQDARRMLNPLQYLDNFHSVRATEITETSAKISFKMHAGYDTPMYGVQLGLSPEDLTWVDIKPDEMGWHASKSQKSTGSYGFENFISGDSFELKGEYIKSGGEKLRIEPGTTYYYRLYYTTPFYENYKGYADIGKFDRYFSKVYQFKTAGYAKGETRIMDNLTTPGEIEFTFSGLTGGERLGYLSWPTNHQEEMKGAYLQSGPGGLSIDSPRVLTAYASRLIGPVKTGLSYSIQLFAVKNGQTIYSPIRRFTAGGSRPHITQKPSGLPLPVQTALPLMPFESFDASMSRLNFDLASARVKDVRVDRVDAYSADISLTYEGRDTPCLFELIANTKEGEKVIALSQVDDSLELKNSQNRVHFYAKGLTPETRYDFSVRVHYFYSMGDVVDVRDAGPEKKHQTDFLAHERQKGSSKSFTGKWGFDTKVDLNLVSAQNYSIRVGINSFDVSFNTKHPLLPTRVSLTVKGSPGFANPGFPSTYTFKYSQFKSEGFAEDFRTQPTRDFAFHYTHLLFEYETRYSYDLVLYFNDRDPLYLSGTFKTPVRPDFDTFKKQLFPTGEERSGEGFTYIVNNGYAMLTGVLEHYPPFSDDLDRFKSVLPERLEGCPVIAVDHGFPWHEVRGRWVEVPNGYRAMGKPAFRGQDDIPAFTLELPASLSIIEGGFFNQIYDLKMLGENPYFKLEQSYLFDRFTGTLVAEFGASAALIPEEVSTVGESAFSLQQSGNAMIPDTVRHLEDESFMWLQGEKMKIVIPEGVLSIGKHCFGFVDGTLTVYVPTSVNSIHPEAFGPNMPGDLTIVVKEGSYAHDYVKGRPELEYRVE